MNPFKKSKLAGWMFTIIPSLLILLFYFYPMVESFRLSLSSGKGINLQFVGFDNYVRLFSDTVFLTSLKNTLIFLVFQVPIMVLLAIFFAVLLNNRTLKFKGIFRTIVFLPAVTSLVAYSLIFKSLFENNGILNQILQSLHIISEPILWLSDPFWAKVVIVVAITWRWTGYNMIFFLSALQNVDPQIYEAADVDGAGPIRKFFTITVPLLKPVILFTTITSTIGTLQLFDEPMNITQGGPAGATQTISQYIYDLSFKYTPDFGYAASVSYAIVVLVIVLSIIQSLIGGRDEKK